uniref:Uncharacterized protein MANES_09G107600 n=1 Tax=Rhizophora mucronata TaxID=61149 RepID=A0A2P2P424_RHIMU
MELSGPSALKRLAKVLVEYELHFLCDRKHVRCLCRDI